MFPSLAKRPRSFLYFSLACALFGTLSERASALTAYGLIPLGQTGTDSAGQPLQTSVLAAYDNRVLDPPPLPNPLPALTFQLDVARDAAAVPGLSIPHVGGSFYGFSIEMSVINQIVGKNSSLIHPIFLNFVANIVERSGSLYIRWGGNTQEYAALVPELPHGRTLSKEIPDAKTTTQTPAVLFTMDMFYMMTNISSLVNVRWFLGIPFNQTSPWRLDIAEHGQEILGDLLLGLQAGNEPDLYVLGKKRQDPYTPQNYHDEVGDLIKTIDANPNMPVKNKLIAPSVSNSFWAPERIWETGFIEAYNDRMYAWAVERYPTNNCYRYGQGTDKPDEQALFAGYTSHGLPVSLAGQYADTARLLGPTGKPLIMFETNTASCGGFAGISDSFGAALWSLDYGFQLAATNFTHALMHFGGQNVFYNAFTAAPTNQSTFNQWTVGSVYYSILVMAEAFGKTNTSRIADLHANAASDMTPVYAIYEGDVLNKLAIFNYMDGSNNRAGQPIDLKVRVNIPNAGVPQTVRVKYLGAPSISVKNITWAGQTFGDRFNVDGRLTGALDVKTVTCTDVCEIPVPAPGFALVFFDTADPDIDIGQSPQTYATTRRTRLVGTATTPQAVLATSNGHSAQVLKVLGNTSPGGMISDAMTQRVLSSLALVVSSLFVTVVLFRVV